MVCVEVRRHDEKKVSIQVMAQGSKRFATSRVKRSGATR